MNIEIPNPDETTDASGTVRLLALKEVPEAATSESDVPGDDPYNRTFPPVLDAPAGAKRRSLDDMRRLSEIIKAKRSQT